MRWWASQSYRSASSAMRHRSAPSRGRRPSADHRKGRQSRGWAGRPSPRQERLCHPWLKTGRGRRPGRDVRCVLYRDQMPVWRFFQEREFSLSTSFLAEIAIPAFSRSIKYGKVLPCPPLPEVMVASHCTGESPWSILRFPGWNLDLDSGVLKPWSGGRGKTARRPRKYHIIRANEPDNPW